LTELFEKLKGGRFLGHSVYRQLRELLSVANCSPSLCLHALSYYTISHLIMAAHGPMRMH